jgi:DnaJ-class molecular chaperone
LKEELCKSCKGTGQVGYAVDITECVPCPDCYGYGTNWRELEEKETEK